MPQKLILDPTQPQVQSHQTLVAETATIPKVTAACAHYGIKCDRDNTALARLRLAVLFAGAAPPEDEPEWLTDLLPLFEGQAWKTHATIKQWAGTHFGERWRPAQTIASSIAKAVQMALEDNDIDFTYRSPKPSSDPEPSPDPEPATDLAVKLPGEPQFNIVNSFSEFLHRDLSQHPLMGKKTSRERQKTDWIETKYIAPALECLGLRRQDALYAQELSRLKTAFRPSMVARRDSVWIAQQLDFDRVKVTNPREKARRTARLLPWNIIIAGPKVSPPLDFLVAFTVSRSISLAALRGDDHNHETAPPPSQPRPLEGDDDDNGEDEEDNDNDNGNDKNNDNDNEQSAAPKTLVEAFLNTYQVRQLLADPDPSKSRERGSAGRSASRKSRHEVKAMLTGPRTTAFSNFVRTRCTGYSERYPLGLRYQRDRGPPFDPDEYAGRPHPAVSPDLCFPQRGEEKKKLQPALPASE